MTPFWRRRWVAYWQEEGCDITYYQGLAHARDKLLCPTEEDSYLNIDSWLRGLNELDMSNLCFLLEAHLQENYCPCCQLYLEPAVLLGGETLAGEIERICSDCDYIEFIERTCYQ